jgi:hypothetical protein
MTFGGNLGAVGTASELNQSGSLFFAASLMLCGTLDGRSLRRMIDELLSLIAELEGDRSLDRPDRVRLRIDALDRLDAYLLNGESPVPAAQSVEAEIYQRAKQLYNRLEVVNLALYQAIRGQIQRRDGHDLLLRSIDQSGPDYGAASRVNAESYDDLDELIGGVLQLESPEMRGAQLDSEMVPYQPTPARHIFDLIGRIGLGERDVLVDFGSGLGHVPLLAGICTVARSIGIELEAAYVHCARQSARALKLSNVTFIQQDAREADLSAGTVFYLYTPFIGTILRAVLDSLQHEAALREIRVCTFGPCTATVVHEPWLESIDSPAGGRPAVFSSRN